ncbi:hypothetical protein CL630_02205 [bacterium]|nr:hypothetical protein [bacterium]|tara:strand:+ start:10304 stop:11923 length:1620 start_codon:yes stop_codon:yes gene_type:complete
MDLQNIFIIFVALINLFLSMVIYFHHGGSRKFNVSFSLIALNVSLWSGAMVLFRYVETVPEALFAVKILYAVALFIPILFFYFTSFFTDFFFKKLKKTIYFLFFASAILVALIVVFTNTIISNVVIPYSGEKIIVFGEWYALYIAHFLFFFGAGFILLIRKYIIARDILLKNQVRNLFLGTFIASVLAMITNLLLPWLGYYGLNWAGNILTIFFVGFILYAILRYHLFNLKLIATEALVIFILAILIGELFLVESTTALVAKTFVLVSVALFGYLLIRGVYREIESRRQVEKLAGDLQSANERLKELDQRKSEFVSLASHQLRSPLTAIKGYSSMLLEGSFGEMSDKVKGAVDRVFESSNRLVLIIEDFLTISRIEQGRLKYNFASIDFQDLAGTIIEEMRPSIEKKGLAISFVFDEKMSYKITADSGKIAQVVNNLIDNASKYTPKGSISVRLEKDEQNHKIKFSVKDTGIGMSAEIKKKLFDKFTRADNASRVNVSGAGVGLFVVKQLVEAHHGKIGSVSEGGGRGSTFYIELPAEE